jgi:hypothetical protein
MLVFYRETLKNWMFWCEDKFFCALIKIGLSNCGMPHGIASGLVNQIISEDTKELNRTKFLSSLHNGSSRSAIKRRARKLGYCYKCGKLIHDGECPRNQTISQWERALVIKEGSISYLSENLKTWRRNSSAQDIGLRLIDNYRQTLGNLSIKDPNAPGVPARFL